MHAKKSFILTHVFTTQSCVITTENVLAKTGWDNDEANLSNIMEDWFEQNQFPIAENDSIFPKVFFVCRINSQNLIF